MRRLLLALCVPFAFAGMCQGYIPGMGEEEEKEVIVVPVPEDDVDEEAWCCEYKDDAGAKKFALVEGAAECNEKYGGDKEGRWVSGPECLPCCCKSPNNAEDPAAGSNFELTTPTSCAGVGECTSEENACAEKENRDGVNRDGRPRPRPAPRREFTRPGASGS